MVTGGGKLLWLKPGARHPADKRPLVACWLILLMWDQETGRETRCTSKAVPCWASQHRAAIFLSSSCPCLTSRRFQVEGRSNEAALGDQDVCFVSVNGHCLWCAAHAVGITAHSGERCWVLESVLGKMITRLSGIFEHKTYFILTSRSYYSTYCIPMVLFLK